MSKRVLMIGALVAFCAVGVAGLVLRPRDRAGREWIVGTWRSYELDYGDFSEWKGTAQIELSASSSTEVNIVLISPDGKRTLAGDAQLSFMDDTTLFFGPIGSGLLFDYEHSGSNLTLDLNASGARIHVKLRRMFNVREVLSQLLDIEISPHSSKSTDTPIR